MSPLFRIGNQELVGVDLSATFLKLVHAKISANKTELLNILTEVVCFLQYHVVLSLSLSPLS